MRWSAFLIGAALVVSCQRSQRAPAREVSRPPSILLVTLDTTRADAIGPDAKNVQTPAFNALAQRGLRFRYAYATVPQTLPSHASMMTGLYPAGHGVHENARYVSDNQPIVAERLHRAGYRTAAFVSAFALARRFGLARGFDVYDEDFGAGRAERTAKETTDRVLAWLGQAPSPQPLFLWVHYYDPHYPYTPPEPFATRYGKQPYLGEVASMDEQLGLLVRAFEQRVQRPAAIVVASDHGEGLGEHGEAQHGNLLYQSTTHVPLLVMGPGISPGTSDVPVSTRRVCHTILDWAGLEASHSLRHANDEIVVGEAMKPFLDYGWQPQVMAVEGRQKTIFAGRLEVYDVVADPGEMRDLAAQANVSRPVRKALREYPLPSASATQSASSLDDEGRRKLASLGYFASTARPVVRGDASRPVDMAHLFPILDKASGLFVREQYAAAIPLLEKIREEDPHNLDAALRLATAHSALGHDQKALDAFRKAEAIAPDSQDVRTYLALHYARGKEWPRAVSLLERIVVESPDRVPALEALAVIRERQERFEDALSLRQKIDSMRTPSAAENVKMGQLAMRTGQTAIAVASFEQARKVQGDAFRNDLEIGVLYLAAGRLSEARDALDRVPPSHPEYPMALFKRAQVSVLLREADAPARIEAAKRHTNEMTRELIDRERLFQSAAPAPSPRVRGEGAEGG